MKDLMIMEKGQGAIEYLLIIGAAVIIAVIVIALMMNLGATGTTAVDDAETESTYNELYEEQARSMGNEYVAEGSTESFIYIGSDTTVSEFMGSKVSEGTTLEITNDTATDTHTYTMGAWGSPSASVSSGSRITIVAGSGSVTIPNDDDLEETTFCTWNGEGIHIIESEKVYCGEGTLMWSPDFNGPIGIAREKGITNNEVTLEDIKAVCENLNYAGFDDWRLPTCNSQELNENCELYTFMNDYCDWENCGNIYDYNIPGYVQPQQTNCPTTCASKISSEFDTIPGVIGFKMLNISDNPAGTFSHYSIGSIYRNYTLRYGYLLALVTTRCVRES